MKILINILALMFSKFCFSQIPISQINDALKNHKYSEFRQAYGYDLHKKYRYDAWDDYYREIIDDYKEALINIQNAYPLPGDTISNDSSYQIKLVTKANKIILYDFAKRESRRVNGRWEFYYAGIDSFKNQKEFKQFKAAFNRKYETELIEDDLCNSREVGNWCGLTATAPRPEYSSMTFFVKNREKDSLLVWLRSANTEKQMFGLWGFDLLKKAGYILSDYEQKFVDIAKNRKGSVITCGGCEFGEETIQKFVKEFQIN